VLEPDKARTEQASLLGELTSYFDEGKLGANPVTSQEISSGLIPKKQYLDKVRGH
jgi:hypothetical protein